MPKKTKSIKKTDIAKAWNKKSEIKLAFETIPPGKKILILCEGQTEELYFKGFKKTNVKLEDTGGLSNRQIVDYAIKRKEEGEYDEYWVVFDMDYNPQKGDTQYFDFDNAISKAKRNDIKVAYSNDVFELWLYLHFYYTDQKKPQNILLQRIRKSLESQLRKKREDI